MIGLGTGAALLAGVAGSAHCGAMCGGIAAAFSARAHAGNAATATGRVLAFNVGRLAGYATVGVALEVLVQVAGARVPGTAFAGGLRIVAALWMAVLAVRLLAKRDLPWIERLGAWCWRHIAPLTGPALRLPSALRPVALGMLWGFMPCGLVYSVLLVAASAPTATEAATIMLAFGAGTLPALVGLGAGSAFGFAALAHHPGLRRVAGVVVLGCGMLTAWGGLAGLTGTGHWLAAPTCAGPATGP